MLSQSCTVLILDYSFEGHPIKIIEDVFGNLQLSSSSSFCLTSCQSASNYPKWQSVLPPILTFWHNLNLGGCLLSKLTQFPLIEHKSCHCHIVLCIFGKNKQVLLKFRLGSSIAQKYHSAPFWISYDGCDISKTHIYANKKCTHKHVTPQIVYHTVEALGACHKIRKRRRSIGGRCFSAALETSR